MKAEFIHLLVELGLHVLCEKNLDNCVCVGDSLEDGLNVLAGVCGILHTVLMVLDSGVEVVQLIDVFQFRISAIKFFGQLVPLLLIPLPCSLVVSQTLQPVKSLVVGLLPEVASALHLPGQELWTLGLLGECCPLFLPLNMLLSLPSTVAVDVPVSQGLLVLQPFNVGSELVRVVVTLPQGVCNSLRI